MPIITLHHIKKSFGSQVLLDDVSFTLGRGVRIGLMGRNGEGKSTLLKIMAGMLEADDGSITKRNGIRVSYLPQDPQFEAGKTVFQVVAKGLGHVAESLNQYHAALNALTDTPSASDMCRVAALQAVLESSGAWQWHTRIETAISTLNLDANRDVGELSGGWLRRVALAGAIVSEPDLLLLDEPTNHLDVASIEWLEDFVADFPGSVLFITHDRYFLDAVAEEMIELDRGHVRHFPCSYAEYLEKKAALLAMEAMQHRKFDQLLAGEERWIRQGIPARRKRNEGRVRSLENLRQQRSARRLRGNDVALRVACGIKPGKMLIEAMDVSHAFHANNKHTVIAQNFCHKIMAGDRIGLLGANGIGKTTLLKILLGTLQPDAGRIRHGVRLAPAFLTQLRAINPELKLKDVLLPDGGNYVHIGGHEPRHIVSYMQDFLFDKERLNSRVSALSGGERGRLILARLLLEPSNLLVLDEPTNDLDIGTLAVLEQALAGYDGTILLVSHDRAFMDRVASRVLAFEGDGKIVSIEGGYSDYQAWAAKQTIATPAIKKKIPTTTAPKKATKLSYREQSALNNLPSEIETMEAEQAAIESRFCSPDYFTRDAAAYQKDQQRLDELTALLTKAYARWEILEKKQVRIADS